MLESGEDLRFVTRRLVILASEDIGNADPQALPLSVATMQACEFVGLPECQLTLDSGSSGDLPGLRPQIEFSHDGHFRRAK